MNKLAFIFAIMAICSLSLQDNKFKPSTQRLLAKSGEDGNLRDMNAQVLPTDDALDKSIDKSVDLDNELKQRIQKLLTLDDTSVLISKQGDKLHFFTSKDQNDDAPGGVTYDLSNDADKESLKPILDILTPLLDKSGTKPMKFSKVSDADIQNKFKKSREDLINTIKNSNFDQFAKEIKNNQGEYLDKLYTQVHEPTKPLVNGEGFIARSLKAGDLQIEALIGSHVKDVSLANSLADVTTNERATL